MRKISSLLALGILGATLAVMPVESSAATTGFTVPAVRNESSGIADTEYTVTLDDGTILGFELYSWGKIRFTGAISDRKDLIIPDSVFIDGEWLMEVRSISGCNFDNAPNVTSLTLPATISVNVSNLPSTVKVLHLNTDMKLFSSDVLSNLDKIFVPENLLTSYWEDSSLRDYVLINAEGTEPSKITVNMTKAGEFAQLLLQQTDNWYKVNELTVIGDLNTNDLNVFKRMKQLTKLDLSKAIITDIPDDFDGSKILTKLVLPELNCIGKNAFSHCYRLKDITIPKVNEIGQEAFAYCGASHITLPEGLTSIADYAFWNSKLENVTIPSTVTSISNYCFYESQISSISIPSTVTNIGVSAFRGTKLTSVSLPGIQTIGQYAFERCEQLAELKFAEGLTSIDYQAFYDCIALSEIDLPSTLRNMGNYVFGNCTNIKKVISRAVVPPSLNNNDDILYGCDKTDVKLYVPSISIDKYRAADGWKNFYTILPLEDKTSYAYIYDDTTIDDGTEFTNDCNLAIDWLKKYNNYYCGALDYNGSSILSMHEYNQYHDLGNYSWDNPYSYNAHFTSLIANGAMRADNVQTTLKVNSTNTWYFISLPYDVKVSDIIYTDGAQFVIRRYSGLNRAQQLGDTWQNLTENDVMNAYEGYILKCNKENTDFIFPAINNANKNKVFEKESVVIPLGEYISEFEHNRSWNLIGNPYPCYYDTRRMDFTAPITVWNRYNQRYDAYSPVDDSYILHPAQSFFVQRPINQETITFDKAGRQKDVTIKTLEAKSMSRKAPSIVTRNIYNVIMSDGSTKDRTRFVINNNATRAYELDKDASKFITDDNKAMLVYTIENGVKYAINERSMSDGIISLGFYAPADGEYTLSLETLQDDNLILIDNENFIETAMTKAYRFNATAGYNDTRFTLMFGETTGINTINVDNGKISANAPYTIYTIDGRLVGNYSADNTINLSKGIYIINSKDVKRKIVVK